MKKIVFFANNLEIGGMEKALVSLVNRLSNFYEITIYLLEKKGQLLEEVNKDIIIKEYKISDNSNKLIRKIKNLSNRIMFSVKYKNKYDFSCNYATYSIPCSKLALISSNNSALYVHSNYEGVYQGDIQKIKNFFEGVRIKEFKNVFFVSNESKSCVEKIFTKINTVTLGNIVNCDQIIELSNELINFTYDNQYINLVFVGRFEEESKNIKKMILIMAELKKINDNYRLYLIGDGPSIDSYRQMIATYNLGDRIQLLGKLKNPYPYIKNSSFLILTSNYEGFPVIFQEAFILKKPIISTINVTDDAIDTRDFVFEISGDIKEIAEQITKIKNNKKNEINYEEINDKRIKKITEYIEGVK